MAPSRVGFALTACTSLVACADLPERPMSGETVDAFSEVARVELDTAAIATIGRMNDALVQPDQIVVTDGMSDRVLAFDRNGRFLRATGRRGDGPGEFITPLALLEDHDGTLLVSQLTNRLTRLTHELELADIYATDASTYISDLAMVGDRVTFFDANYREEGPNYAFWDGASGRAGSFDPQSPLSRVPYWNAAWTTHLAVGADYIYVTDSMVYPFRRYTLDLQLVDSVGYPPPSWKQARQPELGEFATPGQQGAQEWLQSFTTIDGVFAVGRAWLVVTHRDRVNQYRTEDLLRADVYQLQPEFVKVWEDIALPGPVLTADEDCAWVVAAYPPQPWTLACLQPRPPI